MEKNEVIKRLYKENPKANLMYVRDAQVHYMTEINDGLVTIMFKIPMEETKGADFLCEMEAKFLIKWIDTINHNYIEPAPSKPRFSSFRSHKKRNHNIQTFE